MLNVNFYFNILFDRFVLKANYAGLLKRMGRFDRAEETYLRALAVDANNANTHGMIIKFSVYLLLLGKSVWP
jgi:hypothetical protein